MTKELSMPNRASLADAKPVPRAVVAKVFERLEGQLGAKVTDLFANADPKAVQEEWAAGLAGYHPDEIARGVAACRERAFAPTLGEFLRLCRPALDPEWAFREAGDCLRQRDAGAVGDWSHPAVWRAACVMSAQVRSGDYARHRAWWGYTLKQEFRNGWGEGVPPPAMRIDHQAKTRAPNEAERRALAGARALFQPRY